MGSRIREKPDHLFEVFVEIASSQGDDKGPFVLQSYPEDYDDNEALAMIPKFAYPCETDASEVDHFTFVLTDVESMFRFGYCRHYTGHQTCLCILSCLPWCEVFFKLLDQLALITNSPDSCGTSVVEFLQTTYTTPVPQPSVPITIVAGENMFNFTSPDPNVLPSIPKSKNLTEYYNAVDSSNMMRIFASMVQERRIYMTSKKLSKLTACIHAAEALLYPMHWQHLYIPILPAHLIDYISAPMPFLIGVHSNLVEKLTINRVDVGDAVIVDLDANTVTTEYDDLESLPEEVSSYLKKSLKTDRVTNSMTKNGDAISVAFLQALVRLIGGYREALKIRPEEPITFDPEVFVRSRPSQSTQNYLEGMLALQIFQQFIYGRLEILNSGVGFTDIFEQKATAYADKLNSQSNYKEWLKGVRKKGLKGGEVLSRLKVKAAPMMSGAVHSVKVQGKKAIADMRTKISNMTDNDERRSSNSTFHISGGVVHSKSKRGSKHSSHSVTEDDKAKRPPRPPPPANSSGEHRTSGLIKEDSHDDSDLRLSYHTVDVSLIGDQEIQAAIMRSASAEVLPKNGGDWSGSTSTVSSDSRSVDDTDSANIPFGSLHSSDDESQSSLVDIPPVGYKSQSSTSGYSTTSSEFATADRLIVKMKPKQQQQQRPSTTSQPGGGHASSSSPSSSPSMSSKPPVIPPRAPTSQQQQSSSSSSTAQPLRPPPRKPNASRQPIEQPPKTVLSNVTTQDAPLIRFESSESEATDSEVFDPLVMSCNKTTAAKSPQTQSTSATSNNVVDDLASFSDLTMREKDDDESGSTTNKNFQRSSSSRSSLTRSKAFRRESTKKPMRKGSSFADDENDNDEDVVDGRQHEDDDNKDIFDPLTSSSSLSSSSSTTAVDSKISPGMAAPVQSRPRRDSSADLMKHEWSLASLASGPRLRLPLGGGPSQYTPAHLPRQQTLPVNPPSSATSGFPIRHQHCIVQQHRGPLTHQASVHGTASTGMGGLAGLGTANHYPPNPSSSSLTNQQTAPFRSRPFNSATQSGSTFQFDDGAAATGSNSNTVNTKQQQQHQKQPMVPSSSLPMSSSIPYRSTSPSHSSPATKRKFESSKSVFSNQPSASTKPSAFNNSIGNRSTIATGQQHSRTLLNLANSSSSSSSSSSSNRATTMMTTTTSNSSSSTNSDPFGDLLNMQFGGSSSSSKKPDQQQQQQQPAAQNSNPKPPVPPAPKWQTFE